MFAFVDGCGHERKGYLRNPNVLFAVREYHYLTTMRLIVLIFAAAQALSMPKGWTKRYDDFMMQFDDGGEPFGWWTKKSTYPLQTDQRNVAFVNQNSIV